MEKVDILKNLRFGERIAEEELDDLERYFVATDQWSRVFSGEVDVVYGSKGAGKSAIYALIDKRQDELFDRGIIVKGAENVRGNTAFKDVLGDPPPSERSFIDLWKLYFLIIATSTIRDYGISDKNTQHLVKALTDAQLLPDTASLAQLFQRAKKLIWSYVFPEKESVEWTVTLEAATGLPVVTRKVNLAQTLRPQDVKVDLPLDELLNFANSALLKSGFSLWVLFDRLDVAFNDTPDLERNALRALFRVYNDFKAFDNLKLKIFVRDDIWERITEGGFAEASHVTRTATITWSYESLLNLFIRRLLANKEFVEARSINPANIEGDFDRQTELIEAILPDKVETGNNPSTFRWMVNRVQDGTGKSAPRELIHMSEMIRQQQIGRFERGEAEISDAALFERAVFKPALREVSKVRYEQTFKAENPSLAPFTEKLKGQKTEQTADSLSMAWGINGEHLDITIDRLLKSGFFEKRVIKEETTYWIPFLYRDALDLVQGKAFGS
ncbi:P-loop ATPase, Sll1717 family [Falsigemmobacter faecalis]|uniref:Uncharacterized protein n=1 Tax=Falsigemmobacter faecalis TaxID=2488730 RepID=A0A3P3DFH6_9RHOB|nr:hypothetical protein [Falsigemmobacter faecalis]RRH71288.1 hypothetical protein EG244_16570 [Falsigemmobacter faecalis]